MSLEQCRTIELPVVEDRRGNLAFAEGERHVPFAIARAFYVYDVPASAVRGGHAHLVLEEAVFCVSGRLEIAVDDGKRQQTFVLDDPRRGLYLPPLVWHDIQGFTEGTIYFGFASTEFDEDDYIRDHGEFLSVVRTRTLTP